MTVLGAALLFGLSYVFILNALDWIVLDRSYEFWPSFMFTAIHSMLFALVIYAIIAIILYSLGIVPKIEDGKQEYLDKIAYRKRNETYFIPVDQVQYFEAEGNYISLYSDNFERRLLRKTLNKLEKELDPEHFRRIHRRYIINLDKVVSFAADPQGGYKVFLKNRKALKVSKGYANKIIPLLKRS